MKKILKNCLIATTFILITGGSVAAGLLIPNKQNQLSENTIIKSNGIDLKLLNTTTNSSGEKDQTFSYTITPSNASNQDVIINLTYIDDTDCSSVMSYILDTENKTITLSCKSDFNKKIKCKITSKANSAAFSELTIDYVKKIKSIYLADDDYNSIIIGESSKDDIDGDNVTTGYINVIKDFTIVYSKYTKDQEYNIVLKEAPKFTFDMNYASDSNQIKKYLNEDTTLKSSLEDYVNDLVLNPKIYKVEDLWDLKADNIERWHKYLLDEYIKGFDENTPRPEFTIDSIKDYVFEDTISKQTYKCDTSYKYTIELVITGDLSKYYIDVDSLTSETNTLDF